MNPKIWISWRKKGFTKKEKLLHLSQQLSTLSSLITRDSLWFKKYSTVKKYHLHNLKSQVLISNWISYPFHLFKIMKVSKNHMNLSTFTSITSNSSPKQPIKEQNIRLNYNFYSLINLNLTIFLIQLSWLPQSLRNSLRKTRKEN